MADADLLRLLGAGAAIDEVMAGQGWDGARFEAWWRERLAERLPALAGAIPASVAADVEILRDDRGVPHCFAADDEDLFLAYGFVMAQDRLFQLDVRRRKGHGTLAALIGPAGLADDRVAHTIGFGALAAAELARLDAETRRLYDRFADGIELAVSAMGDRLPIEYALLGAGWEPWSALDSIACTTAWRWQFTGRPHVIAGPELLKRALGDDELVAAILLADREADASSLPPDAPYPPPPPADVAAAGPGSPASLVDVSGSNNWVIAGSRSSSGRPLLASDPHMPFEWASAFYDVGLHGGSFDAVGAGLVGQPGLLFGRDRDVAWGITNNICSLRDLYQERPTAGADGSYAYAGAAEPAERSSVTIEVRGAEPEILALERTRRGPIIDAILPPPAHGTGPVSMRWLGSEACDWPAAMLRLARSTSVRDARAALDGWLVPSFAFVLADRDGSIGYVTTGRIPLRSRPSRTYRPGWDPDDDWVGLIPHAAMPAAFDPDQGWLGSANNRPAPDDYPYPLSGTWSEGHRLRRIGRLIEERPAGSADRATLRDMHADVHSTRAEAVLPDLLALLRPPRGERETLALDLLDRWDRRATADSAAAAIYEVVIHRWAQAVMGEHIDDQELADYLANWGMGFAVELLARDDDRWFTPGRRDELVRTTFAAALDEITARLGDDMSTWRWGAIHRRTLRHALSGIGDLDRLLDKPTLEVGGDMATLNNSGFEAARPRSDETDEASGWDASSGAGYRLEVDLGEEPAAIWSITAESQSALPGSAHYDDQMEDFMADRTRRLPLDRDAVETTVRERLRLIPDGDGAATPGTVGTAR